MRDKEFTFAVISSDKLSTGTYLPVTAGDNSDEVTITAGSTIGEEVGRAGRSNGAEVGKSSYRRTAAKAYRCKRNELEMPEP